MVRKILVSVLALAFVCAVAQPAFAVGTPAGTVISNQAYADYTDANGNALPRAYSNTVTTTVSQVAMVMLEPPSGASAGNYNAQVPYLVQIFNYGNGNDNFTFDFTLSGDWTPTSVELYHDADNSHTLSAGDPLIGTGPGPYSTAGYVSSVTADDDFDVIMVVTIPDAGGPAVGTSSVATFSAASVFDPTKTATGDYTTTVDSAVVMVNKSHIPGYPYRFYPGETVPYTLTLTNTGTSDATSVVLTDIMPANLTYITNSTTLNSIAKTDASDADEVTYNSGTKTLTISAGTIAASGTVTITFQGTPTAGTPSGTEITNQSTVAYMSGSNPINVSSNGDTFFVATASSIAFVPTTASGSGDPGTVMTYAFTAYNNGNATDVLNLSYISGQAWTWALWADANSDGIAGNDGDYLLTDTNADGSIDTGSIAQNGSIALLAVATIPPGTSDGTVDGSVITGTSVNDITKTVALTLTTTVNAPSLSMSKTVSPTGNQPPGTELVYTAIATNNGHGTAKDIVITDLIPAHTTYKPGSILTGSTVGTLVSRTDGADADNAAYDSGSNAVVVGSGISKVSLGYTGTHVLRFTVTID